MWLAAGCSEAIFFTSERKLSLDLPINPQPINLDLLSINSENPGFWITNWI